MFVECLFKCSVGARPAKVSQAFLVKVQPRSVVVVTESPPTKEESSILFLANRSEGKIPRRFAKTPNPTASVTFTDLKSPKQISKQSNIAVFK